VRSGIVIQSFQWKEKIMEGLFRIFVVSTGKPKPGKNRELAEWWTNKGEALFKSLPGTKDVNTYAVQFRLGGEYVIEIWREVENYASLDQADEEIVSNPKKYGPFVEVRELIEFGPTRIMGDWPASALPIGDEAS
jgi:hypothetical protein